MHSKPIIAIDAVDGDIQMDLHAELATLALEQCDYLAGGAVAEKLPQGLLVIRDAVLRDQRDEIGWLYG